jgi:hypothetical protein
MATDDLQNVFERYDRNKTGAIEIEELRALLGDMGLLANKTLNEADSFVVQQFAAADADKDSKLEFEEFAAYYGKVATGMPCTLMLPHCPAGCTTCSPESHVAALILRLPFACVCSRSLLPS